MKQAETLPSDTRREDRRRTRVSTRDGEKPLATHSPPALSRSVAILVAQMNVVALWWRATKATSHQTATSAGGRDRRMRRGEEEASGFWWLVASHCLLILPFFPRWLATSVSHSFLTAWWLSHRWRGGSGAISIAYSLIDLPYS